MRSGFDEVGFRRGKDEKKWIESGGFQPCTGIQFWPAVCRLLLLLWLSGLELYCVDSRGSGGALRLGGQGLPYRCSWASIRPHQLEMLLTTK